jgi:putative tricarboxylic transport membrane protein
LDRDEMIGGIALFLFGIVTVVLSLRMPIGTFRAAGSGLFPLCLGILLMGLAGVFITNLYGKARRRTEEKPIRGITAPTQQLILFWGTMALVTLFFDELGYPLASFLLLFTLLRILGMKRWSFNILLSLATAVVSYFLFVQWLQIPLPKGWLGL